MIDLAWLEEWDFDVIHFNSREWVISLKNKDNMLSVGWFNLRSDTPHEKAAALFELLNIKRRSSQKNNR